MRIINPTIFASGGAAVPVPDLHRWCPSISSDETDSVGTNDGTLTYDATIVADTDAGGEAFSFDGVNDQVTASAVDLSSGGSVSVWVKLPDISKTDYIVANRSSGTNKWAIIAVDANLRVGYYDGTAYGESENFSAGWQHVVLVYDGSTTVTGYLNGAAMTGANAANPSGGSNLLVFSGRPGSPSANEHDSLLDDVSIWSTQLTADDVTALYASGSGRGI